MRWLHLSDIHFNLKGYDAKNIQDQLLIKLKELNLKMDFILITGDCLYKFGEDSWDSRSVIKYIKDIANACECPYKKVYLCPGNHDIDRGNSARNDLIDAIRNGEKDFSENFESLFRTGHDRFQIIYHGVTSNDYEPYMVSAPNKEQYRIISIDSCLLSKDNEDCQKLKVFNEKIYDIGKKIKNDKRINILIMHHGIENLELADARKFEHWVEDNNIDIVFCGHTHRAAVNSYDDLTRDIKQFTAGAVVVDDYAVPSFYICEYSDVKIQIDMSLYTFAEKTEKWILDNQLLRKFGDGKYVYELSRHKNLIIEDTELIIQVYLDEDDEHTDAEDVSALSDADEPTKPDANASQLLEVKLISKYLNKYGSDRIYSNKHDGYEKFDFWKMIDALIEVGMSYIKASEIACEVIQNITSDEFQSKEDILSSEELKDAVYETIIHHQATKAESEYEISCWASRYARKYSRSQEIMVTSKYGVQYKLNYEYIKNTLLKNVIDAITNNEIFYEKIFRKELTRMAEDVLGFLKKMGVFEIREEALVELVKEYITQKPHPWLVNGNRDELVKYHKEQGIKHINDLQEESNQLLITQMEAAYHTCAAFLVQYDDYIGCTETSPITILTKSVNGFLNKNQEQLTLPMQKYQIVQMKKDFLCREMGFADFQKNISICYRNIVNAQKISLPETRDALINLWGMLMKLEEPPCNEEQVCSPVERVRSVFIGGRGFLVKANLRDLTNCFWVEPNWEEYEIRQQHLGKQILVCVLEDISEVKDIYCYLYDQNAKGSITEIAFVLKDYSVFNSENRKKIREQFKGKYLRCIFIQEEDFKQISDVQNWRTVFYKVLEISKIS